jgi:hypothetical protein
MDRNIWTPFGGWDAPEIKQYVGDAALCGLAVDLNEMAEPTEEAPVEEPRRFNPDTPDEYQRQSWSCSIRAATWLEKSVGFDVPAEEMQDKMVAAGVVNSEVGLTDATGSGLRDFLGDEFGLAVHSAPEIHWEWLTQLAGNTPMIFGGRAWNHWAGIRGYDPETDELLVMNPAGAWMGVGDRMNRDQFNDLGAFAVVWVPLENPDVPPADSQEWLDAVTPIMGNVIRELRAGKEAGDWDAVDRAINELVRNWGEPPEG